MSRLPADFRLLALPGVANICGRFRAHLATTDLRAEVERNATAEAANREVPHLCPEACR